MFAESERRRRVAGGGGGEKIIIRIYLGDSKKMYAPQTTQQFLIVKSVVVLHPEHQKQALQHQRAFFFRE